MAVDNGSLDDTRAALVDLASSHPQVVLVHLDRNSGYGNGVLAGLPLATAPWVGIIPADGQVDADDVVRLFESLRATDGQALGKVRRRFRMDGLMRALGSVFYNVIFRVLWPRLPSFDVNGSPKIFPRRFLETLDLQSRGWFLDPELLVKAHYLELKIVELNVFSRMRTGGLSAVKAQTYVEFFFELVSFRVSPSLRRWRRRSEHIRRRELQASDS